MEEVIISSQTLEWNRYYRSVSNDFKELKKMYPFSELTILPSLLPKIATIRVIAANKDLIQMTGAVESDFTEDYSRELYIEIPTDYKLLGCKVYGAKWIDINLFEDKDIHFYNRLSTNSIGFELCVGVPESFPLMKNVILENVRTAENMLIAYERVMTGRSNNLELISYTHGEAGQKQYQNSKSKYISGVYIDVKNEKSNQEKNN